MTDQTNDAPKTTKQGYNLIVSQLTEAVVAKNANDKLKITFRGKTTAGKRTIERTFVAQGAAAEQIQEMVGKGNELKLRCLFSRAPSTEDGKRGGEFLTVIGLPLPPKKKAA